MRRHSTASAQCLSDKPLEHAPPKVPREHQPTVLVREGQRVGGDADARRLPKADEPFNILFLDPPYGCGLAEPTLKSLVESGWIGEESLTVLEVATDDSIDLPEGFLVVDERQQGKSRVIFLTMEKKLA